jgi:iron(III) transport system permease protein
MAGSMARPNRSAQWWAYVLAALMALPLLAIIVLGLGSGDGNWGALLTVVLPHLLSTTLMLCLGCAALTLFIGTSSALLVSFYEFPFRRVLSWMALLPLALPGYIISFVYVDALTYAGPLQGFLRGVFGWAKPSDYWFPDVRSVPGAIVVLSFALYPYVYLSARAAFLKQPANQLAVARTLGRPFTRALMEVALPQARAALFVGALLVVLECLNDIGAATFFGVRTLTIAVFSAWLDAGDLATAAQLALMLVSLLACVVIAESLLQAKRRGAQKSAGQSLRKSLSGSKAMLAFLIVALPVIIGFVLPVVLLVGHGLRRLNDTLTGALGLALWHSFMLAALAAGATVLIALALGHASRNNGSRRFSVITKMSSFGYALPGTVLGLGVLVPFSRFDLAFNNLTNSLLGFKPGLLLTGSIFALVFAYVTRFLMIGLGQIEDGFQKIPTTMDHAARTLGRSQWRVFQDVHLPLLKPAMIAASLLVFVDAMKELPATLILSPFDFETLATRTFTLSSLGQFEAAAIPALLIVLTGLIPVVILSRALRDSDNSTPL